MLFIYCYLLYVFLGELENESEVIALSDEDVSKLITDEKEHSGDVSDATFPPQLYLQSDWLIGRLYSVYL